MTSNPNTPDFWDQQYTTHPNTPHGKYVQLKNHHELWHKVRDLVVERMDDPAGFGVFDIGCGPGVLAYLLFMHEDGKLRGEVEYTGLDFSERARRGFEGWFGIQADMKLTDRSGWRCVCKEITPERVTGYAALCRQPLTLVCCETLEHLTDDIAICNAMGQAAGPGSRVIVTVPTRPSVRYHLRHYSADAYHRRIHAQLGAYRSQARSRVGSWIVGAYDY